MVILLGFNDIVVLVVSKLIEHDIPYVIYSDKDIVNEKNYNYHKVDSLQILQERIVPLKDKSLIVSIGAPWIFKDHFLSLFEPQGIFNVHGSGLPMDKGGTIVSWLILNRKRLGHAVMHKVVSNPDAGPILASQEFIYSNQCQLPIDFINEYNKQQSNLLYRICVDWYNGKIDLLNLSEQQHYHSSYWPRLNAKLNAWIDWNWSGDQIELFIRAFDEPYSGARTLWRNKVISLKNAFYQSDSNYHPFQFGIVFRKTNQVDLNYLAIAVSGGTLYVQTVENESGLSVLNDINEGDRFITPQNLLDEAKIRTVKGKSGFERQKDL